VKGTPSGRHRIEHIEVRRPRQPTICRLRRRASMQPHTPIPTRTCFDAGYPTSAGNGADFWHWRSDPSLRAPESRLVRTGRSSASTFGRACSCVTRHTRAVEPSGGWLPDQSTEARRCAAALTSAAPVASTRKIRKGTLADGSFATRVTRSRRRTRDPNRRCGGLKVAARRSWAAGSDTRADGPRGPGPSALTLGSGAPAGSGVIPPRSGLGVDRMPTPDSQDDRDHESVTRWDGPCKARTSCVTRRFSRRSDCRGERPGPGRRSWLPTPEHGADYANPARGVSARHHVRRGTFRVFWRRQGDQAVKMRIYEKVVVEIP